ncbi:MAG: nitrous oxide reductase accessory protein NosL [Acidovorax sp.]|nr:nitrous oxide reductase accessory protein NosL [Acidovorax sp.]
MPVNPMRPAPLRRHACAALALAGIAGLAGWWRLRPAVAAPLEEDVCIVAPPTPYDPASGLPPTAARPVPADARCPVCGMYPARSPGWAAQVIFTNGDAQFFDSPLSLLRYLERVPTYTRGRSAADIAARYVTDADSGTWVEAHQAAYVHGSTALGPMRAGNLPAFATREGARRFADARGGRVLGFSEINAALVAALAGPGHRHAVTKP